MRRLYVLAASAAVIALAAACEPEKATGALWTTKLACDQPRVDLAKAQGQPLFKESDSQTLQTATWELWHYEATATRTGVTTLTTTEYYFEWNTQRASSAPGACFRDTTVTVVTI